MSRFSRHRLRIHAEIECFAQQISNYYCVVAYLNITFHRVLTKSPTYGGKEKHVRHSHQFDMFSDAMKTILTSILINDEYDGG